MHHRTTSLMSRLAPLALGVGLFSLSSTALAGTLVANDVNLTNYSTQNIAGVFTNYEIRTFPYDESYGPDNFWTKFDVIENDDGSFGIRIAGKYISAGADGSVALVDVAGEAESFNIGSSEAGSYVIQTWRGTYLASTGENFNRLAQATSVTDAARWHLFDSIDPATEGLQDGLISGSVVKNIAAVFTNYVVKTFPYDQSYGPLNYWANWDLVDYGDGTVSFKIGNYYLTTDPNTGSTSAVVGLSDDSKYTLVSDVRSSYHLQTSTGQYLKTAGTGFNNIAVADETSNDTRWNFFEPVEITAGTLAAGTPLLYGTLASVDENWAQASFDGRTGGTARVLADMQTYASADTAGLRIDLPDSSSFEVFAEEETSLDEEVAHDPETVGYIATDSGVIEDSSGNPIGEVGRISADQTDVDTWTPVTGLALSYQNPVVRMTMNSYNGGQESHIRLRNITADGFEFKIEEWEYLDGGHTTETMTYMIVEAGTHSMIGGVTLQAQTQSIDEAFAAVNFSQAYTETPVVLSQSQTYKGNDPIVTRQRAVDLSSVEIRVQEEEGMDQTHAFEIVGIISIGR